MHCQISPRITCNPCGNTTKISLRYHRLLIYDVKRTTKTVWVPLKQKLESTHVPIKMLINHNKNSYMGVKHSLINLQWLTTK